MYSYIWDEDPKIPAVFGGETPEVGPMCRYDGARRDSEFRIFSQLEKLIWGNDR